MKHYAGQYYHVYNRGTNRQPIFANEENYHFLLRRAAQFLPLYPIRIIAYVLMPNDYHFLVGADQDGVMAPFSRDYSTVILKHSIVSKTGQVHYLKDAQKVFLLMTLHISMQ